MMRNVNLIKLVVWFERDDHVGIMSTSYGKIRERLPKPDRIRSYFRGDNSNQRGLVFELYKH